MDYIVFVCLPSSLTTLESLLLVVETTSETKAGNCL